MNRTLADRVANAVLYEGYVLYPYRPSVKNRQRWTFGGLYPESYCVQTVGSEAAASRTECPVRGTAATAVEVVVRFLHLTARQVGEFDPPLPSSCDAEGAQFRPVELLRVGERILHTWQEAEERDVAVGDLNLGAFVERPHGRTFAFPGRRWREPVTAADGTTPGVLAREQQPVTGEVEVSAAAVADGLYRLAVGVRNLTPLETPTGRDDALLRTLVSAHTLLGVHGGDFVSLLDPPDDCRGAAAGCRNVGVWPVLVGEEGGRDTVLVSPIILYDHPRVAPESKGDLFDATEIDEILSLRILTLTDEEKRLAAAVDDRTRALLARTEGLGADDLLGMHGTIRSLRPVPGGADG
jgi:hydrogenase maturation protease